MDEQQKQLVAKLKDAQNVLVTVSKNPSVDQLAAAIGLTLALNKLDKHATAVYSGQTPSTIEFLKPEETLETNTDSLRDFIIALDKSKADKLRYKVEDQVVRIFITPYRTSISEKDLEFSQGDFNVDVVIALGVKEQTDLDEAISAHGRILHDALVSTLSIEGTSDLGTLNIVDAKASSLSEVVTKLVQNLDNSILDMQIATALLTGIVAMTERFSNDRTSPETMNISASLMSAGANQQLIANELDAEVHTEPERPNAKEQTVEQTQTDPGTLAIDHNESSPAAELPPVPSRTQAVAQDGPKEGAPVSPEPGVQQIYVDENGQLLTADADDHPKIGVVHSQTSPLSDDVEAHTAVTRERVLEPPMLGGELTANTNEESLGEPAENLTAPSQQTPILSHNERTLAPAPNDSISLPKKHSAQSEPMTLPPLPRQESAAPQMPAPSPIPPPTPVPSVQDIVSATAQQPNVAALAPEPSPKPPVSPPIVPSSSAMPAPSPTDEYEEDDEYIDTSRQTLSDIEHVVDSPHLAAADGGVNNTGSEADVDAARKAVEDALAAQPTQGAPDPIAALNAQPLGPQLREGNVPDRVYQPAPGFGAATNTGFSELVPGNSPADQTLDMPLPPMSGVTFQPGVTTNPAARPRPIEATLPAAPSVPPPPIFPNT